MLEKLEEAHVQIVHIHAKDLIWIKKNKEILVHGKMFDVKQLTLENNVYSITGLFDEKIIISSSNTTTIRVTVPNRARPWK